MAKMTVLPRDGERSHHGPEALARFDVEADGRLVEHEQVGIGDERDCEASTLRLTARQSLRAASRHVLQTGEDEHLVDPERVRIQRRNHRDQLAHREVADQRAGLQHDADGTGLDGVTRGHSEQLDVAPIRSGQPEHHVDRGRLAGAVRPEQGDGLTWGDGEVDAPDRLHRAVGLGHVDNLDTGDGGLEVTVIITATVSADSMRAR